LRLGAQAVERGIGFDGHRVEGVRLAHHQACGHTLVKEVLEHGGEVELARATASVNYLKYSTLNGYISRDRY